MFTSCFRNVKLLSPDLSPVSIARWPPRNWRGRRCYALAPSVKLLRAVKSGAVTWQAYRREYLEQLAALDAAAIAAELMPNAVLLCFEDAGEPCHRRLAAEWLERKLQIFVPEW